jgi:methylenetetrahydrofolate/methylenetetrahydromethanopterin dehydrogenase (NADP+)
VKKILVQLDTDQHPSAFDAMVAHDAGIDVLLPYGAVETDDVQDIVQGAYFTRSPGDPNLAIWVGGSDVRAGEAIFEKVQETFFGPFQVSIMLDSDGCNTTAGTAIAQIVKSTDVTGKRAVVIGVGPVGLRSAVLLKQEGAEVQCVTIPADVLGTDSYRRPRGLDAAEKLGLDATEPGDRGEMEKALEGANIIVASGPAGVALVRKDVWAGSDSIEIMVDYNAAEPLGIEDIEATDELEEREGKTVLGALGVGGAKMKVHKACVGKLFESSDVVMNADGVYSVARETI